MKNKKMLAFSTFAMVLLTSTVPCYAANDILENTKDLIAKYYDTVSGIAVILGAFLALIALIVWFCFPTDKGSETGKKWFVRIIFCLVIILSLGGIIRLIQNITAGNGFNAEEFKNSIPKIN